MNEAKHIGNNIRNVRLLRGMKQRTLAHGLGVKQQNVSKMEKKEKLSKEKLEAAAKVLGVTVEAIENFNEKVLFNNNIALEQGAGQIVHPVKEIMEYFKGEIERIRFDNEKKDKKLEKMQKELDICKKELELYKSKEKQSSISMATITKNVGRK